MTTRARRRVATKFRPLRELIPGYDTGYRAGLLDAIKDVGSTVTRTIAEAEGNLRARLAAQSGGKQCRVCETQAAGLPTPGYTHDEACKRGKP